MATPDRVLDITTDRARPVVRIDQVTYPLRTTNDLTLDAYKTLERLTPRIGALLLQDALTPAEGKELGQLLDQVCRLALVAPPAVLDRLSDVHRVQVFTVFTELLMPSLPRASRAPGLEARPATGRKPSRASNASTVAASSSGSRRSPSASSRRV